MHLCKPVITPLASHFKLSNKTCPKTESEKRDMANIPYKMAIGSWLLRYLNGTLDKGLHYHNWSDIFERNGYVDSDFAGDKDAGNCVSWKSQLQPVFALLTTEAEYIAATEAIKEAIWLQGEKVSSGLVDIDKISTDNNPADFGTKIVNTDKFMFCMDFLHLDAV
ncbi:hypothetical protein M9H77_13684 [Catharanthus roseus]|uniref:Uncharacterized protein n=1 Tax=Catharanthus roseus TaxID=4058 RepID=A0ACC0BL18_CATRO|nr:hypothetical protein M9H77_13684 [Catharanthus roseus]